jgi:23S rRNA pseudouridine955/2504/2580 synthase
MSDKPQSGAGVRFIEVQPDQAGQRLGNFLLKTLKGVPKSRLYRAMRKGEIRVNKGRVKAEYRLCGGDGVRVPPLKVAEQGEPARVPKGLQAELEQRVVFDEGGLLIIDKPSVLAVHGGSGLIFGLIECLRQMVPDSRYLELVHRLDRDTSGLIMIARKASVLRDLHAQLREDRVDKRYLALAAGAWPRSRRLVEAPLEKNTLRSGERMVRVSREGKAAATEFRQVERFQGATLMEAKPITGRTHQIRVHAQYAGHPLLGDDKYSDARGEQLCRDIGLRRLFLHAYQLRLKVAGIGRVEVQSNLDIDLDKTLDKLRKSM